MVIYILIKVTEKVILWEVSILIKHPVVDLNLIKQIRNQKNISIEEMSTAMGYKGYQGYYYKENGVRKMSAEDIAKISSILAVPIDKLFFEQ